MRRAAKQLYDFVVWHCATLRHLAERLQAIPIGDATKAHLLQIFNCRVSCRDAGTDMNLKDDRQRAGKWQGLL